MNKLERIRSEILADHKANNGEDGLYSLTDKYDIENYPEYKAAVNTLNEDKDFPYTVYVQLQGKATKTQYQPYFSKSYEYRQPSEVINVLERLTDHIRRLEQERNISHSTYAKEDRESLHILIESLTGQEHLNIEIENTFKFDD